MQPIGSCRKKDEGLGTQHLIDGDSNRSFECYACDRTKPAWAGAKNCKHEKKRHASAVNSQDITAKKFQELKEAIQKKKDEEQSLDLPILCKEKQHLVGMWCWWMKSHMMKTNVLECLLKMGESV